MKHNAPIGEQTPAQENYDATVEEYPSFSEHMEKEEVVQANTRTLTRPSLKNEELKNGALYRSRVVEDLSKKLKDGEKLETQDIVALTEDPQYYFGHSEEIARFLAEAGFDNGTDFDVRLPGEIINVDGTKSETPLSISFNNGKDFTRVNFSREDNGAVSANTYTGEGDEGVDVGYSGPVPSRKISNNIKTEIFE